MTTVLASWKTNSMSLLRLPLWPARRFRSFRRFASTKKHRSPDHGSPYFSARRYSDTLTQGTHPLEVVDILRHVVGIYHRIQLWPKPCSKYDATLLQNVVKRAKFGFPNRRGVKTGERGTKVDDLDLVWFFLWFLTSSAWQGGMCPILGIFLLLSTFGSILEYMSCLASFRERIEKS